MAGNKRGKGKKNYRRGKGGKKHLGRKSKAQNGDVINKKFRTEFNLTPAQPIPVPGSGLYNYVYYTFPLWNSASLTGITQNKEFLLYAIQYDRWRIHSMTVKVYPKANTFDLKNAQDGNQQQVGDGRMHTVIDKDGNGPMHIQQLTRYSSYKSYSLLKPFSRTYSIKYPTDMWLDCQKLATQDAPFDFRNQVGLAGVMTMYAENVLEDFYEVNNQPWANVQIIYNVSFQGKTLGQLSVTVDDETGLPTTVTLTPFEVAADRPPVPPKNLRGTIRDTITDGDTLDELALPNI